MSQEEMGEPAGQSAAKTERDIPEEFPVELGPGTEREAVWRTRRDLRPQMWAEVLTLREARDTRLKVQAAYEAERDAEWGIRVGEPFPKIDPTVQAERFRHAAAASDLFVEIKRGHAADLALPYLSLESSAATHVRMYRELEHEGPKGPSPTEVAVREARAAFTKCVQEGKPCREAELALMERVIENLGGETQLEHAIARAMVLRAELAAGLR